MKHSRFYKPIKLRCLGCIAILIFLSDFSTFAQVNKTFEWLKKVGGESLDIATGLVVDSKDNIYMTGCFVKNISNNSMSANSNGNKDIIIAKFDNSGIVNSLKTFGGKGNDFITASCISNDGGLIIAGEISDTIEFGKVLIRNLTNRLFIAKLNEQGALSWINTIQNNSAAVVTSVQVNKFGEVFASGTFSGKLEIDKDTLSSVGENDIFLIQFNSQGEIHQQRTIGTLGNDINYDLALTKGENVVVAGSFSQSLTVDSLYILSDSLKSKSTASLLYFNPDLSLKWVKVLYGNDLIEITSIKSDSEGSIYFAGSFNESFFTSDTLFSSRGHSDCFVLKYSEDGKMLSGRAFGSWFYDNINDLTLNNIGGFFVTGSIGGFTTVDDLNLVPEIEGNSTYVLQFSPDGQVIWADCLGGSGRNFGSTSVIDTQGNLYITGSFQGSVEKNSEILQSSGDQDIFIVKYFNCKDTKAEILGELAICPGITTQLSVLKEYSNIMWNDSISGKTSVLISKPGKNWVTMLDKNGCFVADTVFVTHNQIPEFSLGVDTTILLLDSLIISAPEAYNVVQWENSSLDPVRLIKTINGKPGTEQFWLTVSNEKGCINTDTISITFTEPPDWINLNMVQLVAYPNPVKETLSWNIKTDNSCRLIIELTDLSSRVLYHRQINQYFPRTIEQINMNNLKSGPYNLRIGDTSIKKYFKAIRIVKE